jgi:hypothetical protein
MSTTTIILTTITAAEITSTATINPTTITAAEIMSTTTNTMQPGELSINAFQTR